MPSVEAASLTVRINTELNDRGLVDADRRVEETTSRWKTILGTAGGFLLAQGVQMVAREIGGLVQAGFDFEREMANVNSIAQLSAGELQTLSNQVLELTRNPGIVDGPAQLAAGLNDIVGAGFAGAEGLMILEAAAMGAAAGQTQTMVATDALTTVINAYKLEAEDAMSVTDQMFRTVDLGKISFEQLARNLGNTVPIAASVGVAFADLGAAYALMTQQGINASLAETQIASLMKSALNPTQQLTDAVQAHGFASAQSVLEQEGFAGFLRIITEEAGGSGEALFKMLGTQEAVNAATALGGENLDTYIDFLEQMKGASEGVGATQAALDKQMQSASFRIAKMRQQVQVAATMLMGGLAPAISWAAIQMTRFISNGIIPFTSVIGRALRGGFEFRDLIDELPAPLRRTAGALGSVFESVGDVVRALGDRGLSGAISTLTRGGELRQLGSAFSAIGQEAWNAAVAGIQAIPWGTIWDTAVSAIPATVDLLIDLVPKLGQWLWDKGGDLVSWAIGHLPGSATRGDGTEGPAGTNAASTVDVVLDLAAQLGQWVWDAGSDLFSWIDGKLDAAKTNAPHYVDVTIDGIATLGEGLAGIAGDLSGWIQSKLFGGTGDPNSGSPGQIRAGGGGGIVVQIAQIAIDVLDAVASVTAADIETWIQEQIDTIGTITGEINDWSIALTGSPAVSFGGGGDVRGGTGVPGGAGGAGGWLDDINTKLQAWGDAINGENGWLIDATNWVLRISGNPDAQVDDIGAWQDLIQESIEAGNLEQGAIAAFNSIGESIGTAIDGLILRISFKMIGFMQSVGEIWGAVMDFLKQPVPLPSINFDTSGILGAVDDLVTWLGEQKDRIVDAWNDLQSWKTKVEGGGGQPRPDGVPIGNVGGGAGGELTEEARRYRNPVKDSSGLGGAPPIVIPAPDTSAFDAAMATIPTTVGSQMSAALGAASAYATGIGTVVGSAIGAMVGNVGALMTGFTNAVGQGMSNALSAASTYSSAIVSVVGAAFGQLPAIAASTTGQIPGIVAGNLAAAAASAYSSGLAIGQGLAAGMNASLGQVQAAAAALASAAAQAAQARLQVASPSKVFTRIGEQVGDGFVQGIQSRYGAAGRAGSGLAGSSIPDAAAGLSARRSGGQTIQVFALKSDELVRLIEKAERGGAFAEQLPQLIRQGAY